MSIIGRWSHGTVSVAQAAADGTCRDDLDAIAQAVAAEGAVFADRRRLTSSSAWCVGRKKNATLVLVQAN